MRSIFTFLMLFFIATSCTAQKVYDHVSQMPEPDYNVVEYIANNLHYPDTVKEMMGRIVVKFIVNEDGSLTDVNIIKGSELKDQILELMYDMPKWQPGKEKGIPVKVYYTLPITICLE